MHTVNKKADTELAEWAVANVIFLMVCISALQSCSVRWEKLKKNIVIYVLMYLVRTVHVNQNT